MRTPRASPQTVSVMFALLRPTFAYVPACVFDGGVAVDVGQQAEAEAILVV